MASRRARLKAVANLPVRRKPGLSQDSAEPPDITEKVTETNTAQQNVVDINKNQESEEKIVINSSNANNDPFPEIPQAEPERIFESTKEPEKISENPKEPEKISENPKEPEKNSSDLQEPKKCEEIKKDEKKLAGPAKFNRRLKPVVKLPVRKERPQASDSEKIEILDVTPKLNDIPVNNDNEVSSPTESSNVPEKVILDSNELIAPVHSNKDDKNEKEIKQSNKVVTNTPQSPVKATQRPVFLRPNVDLSIRRPIDELKNLTLPQRVRNVSECSNSSSIIQNVGNVQNELMPNTIGKTIASVLKRKRPKSNDLSRKMADARREFHRRYEKIKPDRSSLRMIDLIFYNPTTNPIISKAKSEKKEDQVDEEILAEEKVDDPDGLDVSKADDDMDDENLTRMPVPQVKIGLNGEIILDEKSLVIETTDAKRGREDLQNSVPIFEDRSTKVSYYCRKGKKSKDWTDSETKRFYKALNTIGTDFLLMQQIFPNRDRVELKNKFKREEKLNRNLIDKALNNPSEFNMAQLEKDLEEEKRIAEEEIELKLQKKAKMKTIENRSRAKSSFLAREMVESDDEITEPTCEDRTNQTIATRINTQIEKEKEKILRMKETDMLYEKFMQKGIKGKTTASSDQNENITNCDDFNKPDFKSHRRKIEEVVGNNEEALDLTIEKKPLEEKKPNRKRKVQKIEKKRKKRKKETIFYGPDVEEPPSCDNNEENSVVTRTISDDDFFQLLAANVNNGKESNIKVQVTEDYSPGSKGPGKKIEIIFDEVPPITLKEIEDQPVTVLADCNTTICEDESPKSPEENDEHSVPNETSVIVKNPNASKNIPSEAKGSDDDIENETMMLVIDESDQTEYQYITVEQEVEPVEVEIPEEMVEDVDVENVEKVDSNVNKDVLSVDKNPETVKDKMYLTGLCPGSFVLMSSDQTNEKKLSMYMISEKSQSDGSSVLSPMPVMLPPELVSSLTQEMDCS